MIATTPSGTRTRWTRRPLGRVQPSATSPTGSGSAGDLAQARRPSPASRASESRSRSTTVAARRPPRPRRRRRRWPRGSRRGGRGAGRRRPAGRRPSPRWRRWPAPGWRPWRGPRGRRWRRWGTQRRLRGLGQVAGSGHDEPAAPASRPRDDLPGMADALAAGVPRRPRDGSGCSATTEAHRSRYLRPFFAHEGRRHLQAPAPCSRPTTTPAPRTGTRPGTGRRRSSTCSRMAPFDAPRACGRRIPRALRGLGRSRRPTPSHPEHYYLAVLGTRPDQPGQGRRLGADAARARPVRRRGHRRLPRVARRSRTSPSTGATGSRSSRSCSLPRGPDLWPMWRDPQAPRESDDRRGRRAARRPGAATDDGRARLVARRGRHLPVAHRRPRSARWRSRRYLGVGATADVFKAALRIPNLLQNLLGEGVLSASFIPVYSRLLEEDRREAAATLAGNDPRAAARRDGRDRRARHRCSPARSRCVITPGLLGRAARARRRRCCGSCSRASRFLVLSAFCTGILNSHRQFFLSYVSPVMWNLGQIAFVVAAGRLGRHRRRHRPRAGLGRARRRRSSRC